MTDLVPRAEFVSDVRRAIQTSSGFAAGKIGISEKRWTYYPLFLEQEREPRKLVAYEASLCVHGLKQSGVFPAKPSFYREFARTYVDDIRNLDYLGLFNDLPEIEAGIVRGYDLKNKLIHYRDQEPDRSFPDNPENCYLPAFAGKKILIVCPFARLLQERATQETFESVWANTGKRWFYPAEVQALEFPYGFVQETRERYATAFDLLDAIKAEIAKRDFDIALIGAAGLGIPIASYIKRTGKIGLSLGGHLQVLFGVLGKRWKESEEWQTRYVNPAWIDMPSSYRPDLSESYEAAYW